MSVTSAVPKGGESDESLLQPELVSALVVGVLLILTCIAIISYCLMCHKRKKKVSSNEVLLQSFNESTHTDISRSTEQQKDAANPSHPLVQNYLYQHQYVPQPINQSDGFSTSSNHAMQWENSPEYAIPYQHTVMPAHPHPAYQPVQDDEEHIYY